METFGKLPPRRCAAKNEKGTLLRHNITAIRDRLAGDDLPAAHAAHHPLMECVLRHIRDIHNKPPRALSVLVQAIAGNKLRKRL